MEFNGEENMEVDETEKLEQTKDDETENVKLDINSKDEVDDDDHDDDSTQNPLTTDEKQAQYFTWECPNCGLMQDSTSEYCGMCGVPNPGDIMTKSRKKNIHIAREDTSDDLKSSIDDEPPQIRMPMQSDYTAKWRQMLRENIHPGRLETFHPGYVRHVRVLTNRHQLCHPGVPVMVYVQKEHDFSDWHHPSPFMKQTYFSTRHSYGCCGSPDSYAFGCTKSCHLCGRTLNEDTVRYNQGYVGPCIYKARMVQVKMWTCCYAKEGEVGYDEGCSEAEKKFEVARKYACCHRLEEEDGCRKRYQCCLRRHGSAGCAKPEKPIDGAISG